MSPQLATETVIRARGVTRRFGQLEAVRGLDLDVHRGEVFGFLGPNGAGKSTLIRILIGLLAPTEGDVEVLGHVIPQEAEKLRPRVGYMTQRFSLYEDCSVEENLEFVAQIFGLDRSSRRERVRATLEEYDLTDRRRQRVGTLSGGWKQRLGLAAATVHGPELLVLDEPTAGVDPESRRTFWEKLFELTARGTTVLASTHYMDEAVRCHRLCLMREGERAALGRPEGLTRALEGRVVEIRVDRTEEAIGELRSIELVASVTQLGDTVHVFLAADVPRAAEAAPILIERLEAAGLRDVQAAPTQPNLEDVFVAALLGERLAETQA
jgi:ABC-2 type transport system ATP-binding protein